MRSGVSEIRLLNSLSGIIGKNVPAHEEGIFRKMLSVIRDLETKSRRLIKEKQDQIIGDMKKLKNCRRNFAPAPDKTVSSRFVDIKS